VITIEVHRKLPRESELGSATNEAVVASGGTKTKKDT